MLSHCFQNDIARVLLSFNFGRMRRFCLMFVCLTLRLASLFFKAKASDRALPLPSRLLHTSGATSWRYLPGSLSIMESISAGFVRLALRAALMHSPMWKRWFCMFLPKPESIGCSQRKHSSASSASACLSASFASACFGCLRGVVRRDLPDTMDGAGPAGDKLSPSAGDSEPLAICVRCTVMAESNTESRNQDMRRNCYRELNLFVSLTCT